MADCASGFRTVSMNTVPVNQSAGPWPVVPALFVSFTRFSFGSDVRRRSGLQEHLDRPALVHRPVALGGLLERQGEVEDLARIDLAVADELDELGQEAAYRCRSAVDVHAGHEQFVSRNGDVVGHADETDVAAGPGGADGLHHRLLRADGLDDAVRAEAAGQLLHPGHAGFTSFLDDVSRPELAGQRLAVRVPAE